MNGTVVESMLQAEAPVGGSVTVPHAKPLPQGLTHSLPKICSPLGQQLAYSTIFEFILQRVDPFGGFVTVPHSNPSPHHP
jgi:hypothetical protein